MNKGIHRSEAPRPLANAGIRRARPFCCLVALLLSLGAAWGDGAAGGEPQSGRDGERRGDGRSGADLRRIPISLLLEQVIILDHYFRDTPFREAVQFMQKEIDAHCAKHGVVPVSIIAPAHGREISFGGSAQTAKMKLNSIASDARLDIVIREHRRVVHLYDPRSFPDPLAGDG